jgi:hypothetical protein
VKIVQLTWACCVGTLLFASQAQAHGGVGIVENKCVMKIGPYQLDFTGYQPQNSLDKFCDDIPAVGRTVIVLDVEQGSAGSGAVGGANSNDLRDMAIDLRVLRNVGQASDEDNLERNTVVYVPPKKYPAGTLHWEHDFNEKGNFIGLVSAKDDHGQVFVSRFPFAVGQDASKLMFDYIAGGIVVLGAGVGYLFYMRRSNKAG